MADGWAVCLNLSTGSLFVPQQVHRVAVSHHVIQKKPPHSGLQPHSYFQPYSPSSWVLCPKCFALTQLARIRDRCCPHAIQSLVFSHIRASKASHTSLLALPTRAPFRCHSLVQNFVIRRATVARSSPFAHSLRTTVSTLGPSPSDIPTDIPTSHLPDIPTFRQFHTTPITPQCPCRHSNVVHTLE